MQKISNTEFSESICGFNQRFKHMSQLTQKPSLAISHWLLDMGSLTNKLHHHFGDFKVEVVQECWISCHQAKQFFNQALDNKTFKAKKFWLRKVNLICNDKIVVRAHTLVPVQTFHNQTKRIGKLQSKSLGHFLFTQPNIKRGSIKVHSTKDGYWGRQSIFFIRKYPLLVTEYFEPNFLET